MGYSSTSNRVRYCKSHKSAIRIFINRYYDPATGQFVSVDPLVSQTNKPYSYGDGDPANSTDPFGEAALLRFSCGPDGFGPVCIWLYGRSSQRTNPGGQLYSRSSIYVEWADVHENGLQNANVIPITGAQEAPNSCPVNKNAYLRIDQPPQLYENFTEPIGPNGQARFPLDRFYQVGSSFTATIDFFSQGASVIL